MLNNYSQHSIRMHGQIELNYIFSWIEKQFLVLVGNSQFSLESESHFDFTFFICILLQCVIVVYTQLQGMYVKDDLQLANCMS